MASHSLKVNGISVPVTLSGIANTSKSSKEILDDVLAFPPFSAWAARLDRQITAQHQTQQQQSQGKDAVPKPPAEILEVRGVDIQGVDYFRSNKIGFLKFNAHVVDVASGARIPGIVFMRGGSCAVLIVLRISDVGESDNGGDETEYVVLVKQPRMPVPDLGFWCIPAGMLDGSGQFASKAAEEVEEETGITINQEDLTDLVSLIQNHTLKSNNQEKNPDLHGHGVWVSPGGTDETMQLFVTQRTVSQKEIDELKGRLAGLRDHGENITVDVVKLDEVWTRVADANALFALSLYEKAKNLRLLK
ncbi:hypothetical protein GQ42DRAFT_119244 [Ramicandelaber brevisporus]|nr:hypothetical protein GQ42DRAFT_119244 [Ramicandelaber brevisporus]